MKSPVTLVDSHCHLEMIGDPAAAVAEARRRRGTDRHHRHRSRVVTRRGGPLRRCRVRHGRPASARRPQAGRCDPRGVRGAHTRPRVVAVGEVGLTLPRPRRGRATRRVQCADRVAGASACLVVHVRAGDEPWLSCSEADTSPWSCTVSLPDHVDECSERGYYASFAGNVTYPRAPPGCARRQRAIADRLLPSRPTRRSSRRSRTPAAATPAGSPTAALLAEVRGVRRTSSPRSRPPMHGVSRLTDAG